MCKFTIGKSNARILSNLSVHVAMETTKSHILPVSQNFSSACELRPFSCHDLANDIYSQTAKTVLGHLNWKKVIEQLALYKPYKTQGI